jgi:hypothetical protein
MNLRDLALRHYSHTPIGRIESKEQITERGAPEHFKPHGLWVSVDGNGDGWPEWCEAESFGLGWTHVYAIELSEDANILLLDTIAGLDWFTEEFQVHNSRFPSYRDGMNWPEVAERWDGLIIAPYQWERRLHPNTRWYYSWDCASGCIWDSRAIASFSQLELSDDS